ncbi:hypothetical protein CFIMG_004263RA [Ceratocystis fimbriata CBS 114723]|uniref:Uncharacterized protein n=2 Tax=Ceratocystis TaxID=5157 RepID=A0A0F8B0E7_CERFI|nr:hypothetical protein CFO_g4765 [Ceratocystis platani]PHH53728.1 hypothetical protein CFIMG_004263RA [Ceratocystis fimbriata CBS 114723]
MSALAQLIPLAVFLSIVIGIAWVLYQAYLTSIGVRDAANERMNKKNIAFSKDGLKVGVKSINTEKYVDGTQKWMVKAWNLSGNSLEDKKKRK